MAKKSAAGRRASKTTDDPVTIMEHAEELLGQMMFAIGAGANGVHIKRSAIRKMRARYQAPTYAFVQKPDWNETWEMFSIYTLRYFGVIGRLAAHNATLDGTPAIDRDHLERARVFVEATYYQQIQHSKPGKRGFMLGDICPPAVPPPPQP